MAFSQYLADKILIWIKGTTFPTALSTVFVSLHSGDPGTAGANNNVQSTITGSANRTSVTTSTFSTVGSAPGGGPTSASGMPSPVAIFWPLVSSPPLLMLWLVTPFSSTPALLRSVWSDG